MIKCKTLLLTSLTLSTILSTSIFAQPENNEKISLDNEISKYELSYTDSSYPLSNRTSYNSDITLTKSQPWGKLHYYNNSNYPVTIKVDGIDTKTVNPYSQASIVWKYNGNRNKRFEIYVTSSNGNLNGIVSLAKATVEEEFQKN